ncbi:MAG: hypothetical protein ABR881_29505 [Candidatus Sulfotelmatobacter sp.]|jgi:hypothetical protein
MAVRIEMQNTGDPRVRGGQAQFILPQGTKWKGLKLRAEIEVKGMRHPVRWAYHQKLNDDGSLTVRPNLRPDV